MIKYIDNNKVCSKCKVAKEVNQFDKWRTSTDGYYPSCKSCKNVVKKQQRISDPEYYNKRKIWYKNHYNKHKDSIKIRTTEYQKNNPHIRRKSLLNYYYGLSLEAYQSLVDKNNGKCWICNSFPINRKLFVDHCHKTEKIRGVLCSKCNTAIAFFNDDINILNSAIEYLGGNYGLVNK